MKHSSAPRRLAGLLPLLVAVLMSVTLVPTSARSQQGFDPRTMTGEDILSDMLFRMAMQAMAGGGDEGIRTDQVARAEVLMDMALDLTPDDAELLSMRANLAKQTEDHAMFLAMLRRYVELRPEDDAFRLQLILGEIVEIETLDARLATLEQHLALSGDEALGGPLRSRVASSASLLAQEMGDTEAYLKHLKTAVRADAANGQAAQMTYQFAVDRGANPLKLAAAAINLVRAQPVDSDSRLVLADALAKLGVYDRACEQFEAAAKLPRSEAIGEIDLTTWSQCLIASGQKRLAEDLLNQIQMLFANPLREEQTPRALPVNLELQRRILLGEAPDGIAAYDRAVAQLDAMIADGDNDAKLEMAWVKAIFGPETEEVTSLLENQDQADPRYLRATGFVYMREGGERWARNAFEQNAATDDVAAYGLALLQGKDDAGRARFLREVLHRWPGSFGGLLAANQLQQMNREVVPASEGQAIIDVMNRLPVALWRVDVDRNPWINIRAGFDSVRTAYLEPITATLVLQNALDIPLPIDARVGLGGTTFVSVAAYAGGQSIGQLPPVVVNLGRRLTLMPRERLTHEIRLDRSIFGYLLTLNAPSTLTFNTTFMVDPRFKADGSMSTGPLGGIDTVRSVQAFIPAFNAPNLDLWSRQAIGGRGIEKFTSLGRLARTGDTLTDPGIDPELSRRCIDVIHQAFESGNPVEQSWIALMLTTEDNNRSEFQAVLDNAQRSDHDAVRIAYLIRHAQDPDNQALSTAIRDGSPRVRRFAEGLRDFLRLPPPEEAVSDDSASVETVLP